NATHNHAAGDINSGSFSVARGGTGRTSLTSGSYLVGAGTSAVSLLTSAQVLSDIGASASSHNHDSAYASATHNHDEDYASTGHDHDGDYEASGAVAAHTGDSTDAHAASAISFSATGNISSTTVQ